MGHLANPVNPLNWTVMFFSLQTLLPVISCIRWRKSSVLKRPIKVRKYPHTLSSGTEQHFGKQIRFNTFFELIVKSSYSFRILWVKSLFQNSRCSCGIPELINPIPAAGFVINLYLATCCIMTKFDGFRGKRQPNLQEFQLNLALCEQGMILHSLGQELLLLFFFHH